MLHRPPPDPDPSGWRILASIVAAWLTFVMLGAIAGLVLSAIVNSPVR